MHGDPRYIAGNGPPTHLYDVGGCMYNPLGEHYITPTANNFDTAVAGRWYGVPGSCNGFKFQPSETCPKNFAIFDQTDTTNRVMFHPALVHNLSSSNLHNSASGGGECGRSKGKTTGAEQKRTSSFKEDTEDINALLSSEEENGEEDEDDDLVSTGRTPDSPWEVNSADLTFLMEDMGNKSAPHNSGRNMDGAENLFEALRGIIPGGAQLETTSLIDEAVGYLKSLRVEVEKLGIQNL